MEQVRGSAWGMEPVSSCTPESPSLSPALGAPLHLPRGWSSCQDPGKWKSSLWVRGGEHPCTGVSGPPAFPALQFALSFPPREPREGAQGDIFPGDKFTGGQKDTEDCQEIHTWSPAPSSIT